MRREHSSVMVADWPLWRYWHVTRYPLLVGLLLVAALSASWWFYQLSWWWLQLTLLLATAVVTVWNNQRTFGQPGGQLLQAVAAGGCYGFWIGLGIGIAQFVWQPAVWSFFYLLASPLWQTLVAIIVSFIAGYVYLHWWPGNRSSH
ncbi:MAG: hypothetical protein V1707_03490 [bacterium]